MALGVSLSAYVCSITGISWPSAMSSAVFRLDDHPHPTRRQRLCLCPLLDRCCRSHCHAVHLPCAAVEPGCRYRLVYAYVILPSATSSNAIVR
jgi:hypothetical protein